MTDSLFTVRPRTIRRAPSPKGSLLFGHLQEMRKNPLSFLLQSALRYGDIVELRLVFRVFLLSNPAHIARVLQGKDSAKYAKGQLYSRVKPLIGDGLLTSEGDAWVRQRKLVTPAFRPRNLDGYAAVMTDEARHLVDRWRPAADTGSAIDVAPDLTHATLRVIGKTMLGVNLDRATRSVLTSLPYVLDTLNARFQQLLYLPFLPTPSNLKFNRALADLDKIVDRIIKERQVGARGKDDFLGSLIEERDEDGHGMTPKQLRDEVMTMLLAGHETTSNTLAWTLAMLARYPYVQNAARDECRAHAHLPLKERLAKLNYTTRVVRETMRLYPAVWILGRSVVQDDEIDGVRLPKGSAVFISPYVMHRHPDFWKHPETFDPQRFMHQASPQPFTYLPFSAGPRVCIGERFAMMETLLILSEILENYRLIEPANASVTPEPSVLLRPRGGMRLILKRLS